MIMVSDTIIHHHLTLRIRLILNTQNPDSLQISMGEVRGADYFPLRGRTVLSRSAAFRYGWREKKRGHNVINVKLQSTVP